MEKDALGEVTYNLSLITPIGKKRQIKVFEDNYHLFSDLYENKNLTVKLCLDRSQTPVSIFGVFAKVDLPVFLNHEERPLSVEELIHNYNDLIYCADHIEQVILHDDLKMDAFEPNKESVTLKPSSSSLRKDLKSIAVEKDWSIKGEFIYREREYKDKDLWIRNIWEWNHFDDYVKYLPNKRIIPYYAHDLQEIEIKALNEIERIRDKDKMWK